MRDVPVSIQVKVLEGRLEVVLALKLAHVDGCGKELLRCEMLGGRAGDESGGKERLQECGKRMLREGTPALTGCAGKGRYGITSQVTPCSACNKWTSCMPEEA